MRRFDLADSDEGESESVSISLPSGGNDDVDADADEDADETPESSRRHKLQLAKVRTGILELLNSEEESEEGEESAKVAPLPLQASSGPPRRFSRAKSMVEANANVTELFTTPR